MLLVDIIAELKSIINHILNEEYSREYIAEEIKDLIDRILWKSSV